MLFNDNQNDMRTRNYFVYAAAALLLGVAVSSCESDPASRPAELTVDTDTVSVAQAGGEVTVSLTATRDWDAEVSYVEGDSRDWLDVTPVSGTASNNPYTITLNVDKNEASDRAALVTFRNGGLTGKVYVSQEGAYEDYTTIEEFLAAPVPSSDSEAVWYQLRGTVISIEKTDYGNFWIKDPTGILYVYGLTDGQMEHNDQSFSSLELEIGDVLTFMSRRAEYNGQPQAGGSTWPAYYVSHIDKEDAPESDVLVSDQVNGWMELPAVDAADDEAYVSYTVEMDGELRRNYSMLYDASERVALWVAYPLCQDYIGSSGRTDAWNFDPKIPDVYEPVIPRSWQEVNGYDRGHQIPSGSRTVSDDVNEQTFYFANMTVQNSELNQGVWMQLENLEREWSQDCDTLYVVTGPVLDLNADGQKDYTQDNAGNSVVIPEAFFKVLLSYDAANDTYHSIAFLYENRAYSHSRPEREDMRTVSEIESITGCTFFSNLPAGIAASVKSESDPEIWGL